jgi:hypothetical protein
VALSLAIRARDIRIGRTQHFLIDQLLIAANPFTVLLWVAGLFYFSFAPDGKRYRLIGWPVFWKQFQYYG